MDYDIGSRFGTGRAHARRAGEWDSVWPVTD
jgi:hypothetical protein